jgi:DNA-3-methyladenine glycosylase I
MMEDRRLAQTCCGWGGVDPVSVAYRGLEWGVPVRDDRTPFEFLILEGAQAGLSWSTTIS